MTGWNPAASLHQWGLGCLKWFCFCLLSAVCLRFPGKPEGRASGAEGADGTEEVTNQTHYLSVSSLLPSFSLSSVNAALKTHSDS